MIIKQLGLQDYTQTWQAMKDFTNGRSATSPDEYWLVQHPPVYTQGLNGKAHHLISTGNIPVVPTDRGGQVTYHGPGQLVLYPLVDIDRAGIGANDFVRIIEDLVIATLAEYGLSGERLLGAPGVYIDDKKISALGLRVRKGRSYHGLSFNIDMDLSPFAGINPCGYENMAVCQLADFGHDININELGNRLCQQLAETIATYRKE